ncbi:MAG: hypothetical protein JWP82_2784, partial [Humibacillus sp.]|nr:hypothetical protein [Humibacillus sp.]
NHDTAKGALRVLKRHLIDVIFKAMKDDHAPRVPATATSQPPAAAA